MDYDSFYPPQLEITISDNTGSSLHIYRCLTGQHISSHLYGPLIDDPGSWMIDNFEIKNHIDSEHPESRRALHRLWMVLHKKYPNLKQLIQMIKAIGPSKRLSFTL
jgi:hypothetical protein